MNNAIQEAIENPDQRHSDSLFEGILRRLSMDASNCEEETGNEQTFGVWACLFKFTTEEQKQITDALNADDGQNIPYKSWEDDGHITFSIDDQGFSYFTSGSAPFREFQAQYEEFLDPNQGDDYFDEAEASLGDAYAAATDHPNSH